MVSRAAEVKRGGIDNMPHRTWIPITQVFDCGRLLLFTDFFVLLLVGCSLQSLPWQAAPQKVHKNMAQCFEIISPRLFPSQMRVDTHVACCTGKGFALAVRDVLFGLGISVLLGHSEIDDVDHICGFGAWTANKEVVGLDVTINEVLLVDRLNTGKLETER